MTITVLPATFIAKGQDYVGREVRVPEYWRGASYARQTNTLSQYFTMKILRFIQGKKLNNDRWEVLLPAHSTPAQPEDEKFLMDYKAYWNT